jgi:hypothetical protein
MGVEQALRGLWLGLLHGGQEASEIKGRGERGPLAGTVVYDVVAGRALPAGVEVLSLQGDDYVVWVREVHRPDGREVVLRLENHFLRRVWMRAGMGGRGAFGGSSAENLLCCLKVLHIIIKHLSDFTENLSN